MDVVIAWTYFFPMEIPEESSAFDNPEEINSIDMKIKSCEIAHEVLSTNNYC